MMNWLKIIATLTMLGFFSNANAEGYCNDGIIAEEDANAAADNFKEDLSSFSVQQLKQRLQGSAQ